MTPYVMWHYKKVNLYGIYIRSCEFNGVVTNGRHENKFSPSSQSEAFLVISMNHKTTSSK